MRGGGRSSHAAFVLEGKRREAVDAAEAGPRFGFTVTKQMGKAVVRNRIRRRLRAALESVAPAHARADFDYVVIARPAAEDRLFTDLVADFTQAFRRAHEAPKPKPQGQRRKER